MKQTNNNGKEPQASTITEYYLHLHIDNLDEIRRCVEKVSASPDAPKELVDIFIGFDILLPLEQVKKITDWLKKNEPAIPFEIKEWSWTTIPKENNEHVIKVQIPENRTSCFFCDAAQEDGRTSLCSKIKMYLLLGHVRCPICDYPVEICVHKMDVKINGCQHVKNWTLGESVLEIELS